MFTWFDATHSTRTSCLQGENSGSVQQRATARGREGGREGGRVEVDGGRGHGGGWVGLVVTGRKVEQNDVIRNVVI